MAQNDTSQLIRSYSPPQAVKTVQFGGRLGLGIANHMRPIRLREGLPRHNRSALECAAVQMQAHPSGHVVHARTCATRRRLGVRFALIFGDPFPVEPYMTVHAVGPSKKIRQARARRGHAESLVEPLLRKLL